MKKAYKDFEILLENNQFEESELLVIAEIDYYRPPRSAPIAFNPDSPQFSDPGDDIELEYQIKAFIRLGVDRIDELGNPVGEMIELSPEQIKILENKFDFFNMILDKLEKEEF